MLIEIKNRWNGNVIFSHEVVGNTIAITLALAISTRANLRGANLRGANLRGANLRGANLRGANLYEADLCGANLYEANLRGANLYEANLRRADLCGANLREADLCGANLYEADLCGANLYEADLYGADLYGANLSGANLRGANLREADLREADLSEADLYGANLSGANLREADLSGANLTDATLPNFSHIPEEGAFIAYKKLQGGIVAKLEVPSEAKRTSSLVGRKNRAEFAKVLELSNGEQSAIGAYDGKTVYTVGELVYPDKYDDDIRIECTHGIHFFITRKEAEEY